LLPALQGNLIPQFHLFYWMGLKVNSTWPSFGWTDPFVIGPSGFYTNWGITKPDGDPEPSRPDYGLAAGANYTEVQRNPPVWGWSDEEPGVKHVFICRAAGDAQAAVWAAWHACCSCLHDTPGGMQPAFCPAMALGEGPPE
jgi:hypothetical protein